MIKIEDEIISVLTGEGASLVRFIDVTALSMEQNRGLPAAIFFGIALTPSYLYKVMETADYVQTMIAQNQVDDDELYLKELKAGKLADQIAGLLVSKGFQAYSQSDDNLIATNAWDYNDSKSPLPHKTLAVLAGVGWIGRNNLLVTPEYGSALCIGTVLTDAPLHVLQPGILENRCGGCKTCVGVCYTNALLGSCWQKNISRKDIIDIHKCTTCMQCLLHCPYTQKYLKQHKYEN